MQYRKLGSGNLTVSVLSFGAWQIGDPVYWGPEASSASDAAVAAAIDAGINLFDTAEGYGQGESERALGRALGSRRKDVLIASKVSEAHCAPKALRQACESSLQRLGTEVIDLYQVHWPCRSVPFEDTYGELRRLQEEGKVREIGVSNFGPKDLDGWMASGHAVSNQLGYNLLFRAIEFDIVPTCVRHNVGILAYMPLMQGLLSCRWQTIDDIPKNRRRTRHFASSREGTRHGEPGCEALVLQTLRHLELLARRIGEPPAVVALAWLLGKPGVSSAILGARNPEQLRSNLRAAALHLDPSIITELDALSEPVKKHLGPNADMWETTGRSRIR